VATTHNVTRRQPAASRATRGRVEQRRADAPAPAVRLDVDRRDLGRALGRVGVARGCGDRAEPDDLAVDLGDDRDVRVAAVRDEAVPHLLALGDRQAVEDGVVHEAAVGRPPRADVHARDRGDVALLGVAHDDRAHAGSVRRRRIRRPTAARARGS
jgi:hypothetical protein